MSSVVFMKWWKMETTKCSPIGLSNQPHSPSCLGSFYHKLQEISHARKTEIPNLFILPMFTRHHGIWKWQIDDWYKWIRNMYQICLSNDFLYFIFLKFETIKSSINVSLVFIVNGQGMFWQNVFVMLSIFVNFSYFGIMLSRDIFFFFFFFFLRSCISHS